MYHCASLCYHTHGQLTITGHESKLLAPMRAYSGQAQPPLYVHAFAAMM